MYNQPIKNSSIKIMFVQLVIQQKGENDYRAFLVWRDDGIDYELRGYGQNPLCACDDAWMKFKEDKEFHSYRITET